MRIPQRLTLLFLAVNITACGIQKEYVKTYDGPVLNAEQAALVKPLPGIIVEAIDGDRARKVTVSKQFGSVDADIALAPGRHSFAVNMRKALGSGAVFESEDELSVAQPFDAGHKYLLTYTESTHRTWKPTFKDVTGHPELWCLNSPRC